MSPLYIVSLTLLLLTVVLSIWRGGGWERTTAAIMAVVWAGSTIAPFNGVAPSWPIVALDAAVTLYLIYVAVFSGRRWAVWAAAFQLLLMANHLAFFRISEIQQWAYVTAYYLWGNAAVLALAVGAVTRKHGVNTPASSQDDTHARR